MTSLRKTLEKSAANINKLATASTEFKNNILINLKNEIIINKEKLLKANAQDVQLADLPKAMVERLTLNEERVNDLTLAIDKLLTLEDPVGGIEDFKTQAGGMQVGKMRIPLGLILFVCEARPGAIVEAASLAIKSGNGIIIKAGSEVYHSATVLAEIFMKALEKSSLASQCVHILPKLDSAALKEILTYDDLIDLVIPRGGEGLISFVSQNSRIPVLKHYKGVCNLYVDEGAEPEMAVNIIVNAKTSRPSTCNTLEGLLIHIAEAKTLIPKLEKALIEKNVTILASEEDLKYFTQAKKANDEDFGQEFLDLILTAKIVNNIEEAYNYIARYGTKHTEVIVTNSYERAQQFLNRVDASCVMVNASTRLNDGGALGLGAEIGISTSKLHAYGPMGLKELTTTKFIVLGQGQIR